MGLMGHLLSNPSLIPFICILSFPLWTSAVPAVPSHGATSEGSDEDEDEDHYEDDEPSLCQTISLRKVALPFVH